MSTTRGPRKKKADTQQRPLLDVLVEAQRPLVPDDLYRRAAYQPDELEQVEEFFDETREETEVTKRIEEVREDQARVTLKARSE